MSNTDVRIFILLMIVALLGQCFGTITKVESLLCVICMTLVYILLVLCRINNNIEKRK